MILTISFTKVPCTCGDGLTRTQTRVRALAQARDGVMADGEVTRDLTRALSSGHALCCQLALVFGQLEGWAHFHTPAHGQTAPFLRAFDYPRPLTSAIAENIARNPRPSGVAKSRDGKSRTLIVAPASMTCFTMCRPSHMLRVARSHSASTSVSPGRSSSRTRAS